VELEFKPNFEKTRQFWTSFWKGEAHRPAVSIVIPKAGVKEEKYPPYLAGRDGNFQPIIDQMLRYCETHEFLGDSLPFFVVEWGPDTFSSYLGCDLNFSTGTSWAVPFVEDWDDVEIRFDRNNKWWRLTEDIVRAARPHFDGRMLINAPCLVANLDSLAAMRSSEKLLTDLYECPGKVKRALDAVCRAQAEILDAFAELLDYDTLGSINNTGMYSPGWTTRPQCDISCMISAEMFREFAAPCLEREIEKMTGVEYHLDGADAAHHIEALCEMKKMDVIAWQPTTGTLDRSPEATAWREATFKKIDDLGKGLTRLWPEFADIKRLWQEYKTRKLYFVAWANSKAEADDFMAELETIKKPEGK
jgi:hypothetical protein